MRACASRGWGRGAAPASATILLAALLPMLAADHASAQQWPLKPVHLVVPFVPGGATDILGRIFADRLARVQPMSAEDPAIAEILAFIAAGQHRALCLPEDGHGKS